MRESILFFAWQDADKTPELCPLCQERQPIFEYRVTPGERNVDPAEDLRGYCCRLCGQQLLATLEELTLARWDADCANASKIDAGSVYR
jgi:hypothetical protein